MRNKLYWGLSFLIVLLIGAFVFVMVKKQSEIQQLAIQQLESDLAEAQKKLEAHNEAANTPKVVDISDVKPLPAEPGFKWVRHGDHWDKIPVGQREKIVEPVKPTYTGPLTYHEELLETNPVKALRLQAEERGHWSAKWIPPFPTDDKEAAEIARDLYLITYYEGIGDTANPICLKALQRNAERRNANRKKREEWSERREAIPFEDVFANTEEYQQFKWEWARMNDLARLKWSRVTEGLILDPASFASKTLLTKP